MARWYEGAEESAFKPIAGGYVFQPPSLSWPFSRPRAYLVDAAQKATLAGLLRRQRRQILFMVVAYVLIAMALAVALGMSAASYRVSTLGFLAILIMTMLAVVPIVIVPHIYLLRALRPLLADLPRTDERITFQEQLHSLAPAISGKLLFLGGIGGLLMVGGNLMILAEAIAEGRSFYGPVLGLAVGALLTSYFLYLAILRARMKRNAS
jgi:uncharacterized Tic20 family protein